MDLWRLVEYPRIKSSLRNEQLKLHSCHVHASSVEMNLVHGGNHHVPYEHVSTVFALLNQFPVSAAICLSQICGQLQNIDKETKKRVESIVLIQLEGSNASHVGVCFVHLHVKTLMNREWETAATLLVL